MRAMRVCLGAALLVPAMLYASERGVEQKADQKIEHSVVHPAEHSGGHGELPPAVLPFVESGSRVLALEDGDLNGDGLRDVLLVLERQPERVAVDPVEDGQRSLLILLRRSDGSLDLAKRNDRVILCASCGGIFGDPFVAVKAGNRGFTIFHYGGSNWRWSTEYRFQHSRRDDTWQLTRVREESYHTAHPDRVERKTYQPPRDFGKIDIADFDPDTWRQRRQD